MPDAPSSMPSDDRGPGRKVRQTLKWDKYLRKLERLAHSLIRDTGADAQGLWTIQTDLLDLQRDVQRAITEAKSRRKVDKSAGQELDQLRIVLRLAKRLGDALAWLLFGLDRKAIHALGHSPRVPVSPEERHGDVGMVAIGAHLSQTHGFPVIHDVTDCLRIGDITFVQVGEDRARELGTVEVKTRLLAREPADLGDGETLKYEVTVLSPQPLDAVRRESLSDVDTETREVPLPSSDALPALRRRPDRREDRQLTRMSNALARRSAVDGAVTTIPGEAPLLSTTFDSEAESYWKQLRRTIRTARREGYASIVVDNAVMYIVFYSRTGVTEDVIQDERLERDVAASGLMPPDDGRGWNSIVVNQIPDMHEGRDVWYMPFYLFDIPWNAVSDLMMNRLCIVALVNPGQVMRALEGDGFEVRAPGKLDLTRRSLSVYTRAKGSDGLEYAIELGGLSGGILETVHEFKSVHYVVENARAMARAAKLNLPHAIEGMRTPPEPVTPSP